MSHGSRSIFKDPQLISFRPLVAQTMKTFGRQPLDLESRAVERWTVSPSSERSVQSARFLPGQLDKILGTEFAPLETVIGAFQGSGQTVESETVAFRVKDVDLVDGVLYSSRGVQHLRKRRHRWPLYRIPSMVVSGALYESWIGNRWFGSWLMEDCITYELAHKQGYPVASKPQTEGGGHAEDYESLLGMNAQRFSNAHFEELILFRDGPNNEGKRQRADRMRQRLVLNSPRASHPGVFLLRGNGGDKRILLNEKEIAEGLALRRGFKVMDPLKASVSEIIDACAGARIVAGVEGSHLVHGLVTMPPDAALFVIQPPHRVVSVLKLATDRQGQAFAFLVASGGKEEFSVQMNDVERTLDLLG